jgi:hypothetical protein
MARTTLTPSAPLIQGITSPDVVVDPDSFYAATRRMKYSMRSLTLISGMGTTDMVQLRQSGIVAGLEVRVKGTITFGGTIAGTSMSYEWPFNIIQEARLSANGQSNLLRCRGLTLRAMEFTMNPRLDDTGLTATFGSTAVTSGTLKLPIDDWGTNASNALNPGATVAAAAAYTVDLTFIISVAADPVSLIGSVYAQSQATNLTLEIQWATQAQICTLGGAATFAQALQWGVTGLVYSIPNVNGKYVVPDLSHFHQLTETRFGGQVQGANQLLLPGTGVGRRLMRLLFNTYSNLIPLALTDTNVSNVDWAYGGADVPEQYASGQSMRAQGLRVCGADLGANWGLGLWDFASQFALRDVIDEGSTSDLRVDVTLVSAPTSGYTQLAQETLFAAPVGA